MSRASEWAERIDWPEPESPGLLLTLSGNGLARTIAFPSGVALQVFPPSLFQHGEGATMYASDALRLGRWILDTFSEPGIRIPDTFFSEPGISPA